MSIPVDYGLKRRQADRLRQQDRLMITTAEQLRKVAIRRWIIEGFPNFKIAAAFNLTAARISQIKKEIENEQV